MDKQLLEIIKSCNSWQEFKSACIEAFETKPEEPGYKVEREPLPAKLSEFTKSIQKGLNWNPKDHK